MLSVTAGDFGQGILVLTAVAGVYVAWEGLSAWREQLRGTAEYALARKVLAAVYRLRDAIADARLSGMILWVKVGDTGTVPTEEYENRWRRIFDARTTLEMERYEAEALWGPEVDELIRELIRKTNVLYHLIVEESQVREGKRREIGEGAEARRQILHAASEKDD